MKKKIIALAVLLLGMAVAYATMGLRFQGWNWLKQYSPDILIVRCIKTPPVVLRIGAMDSEVEVVYVLKGTNHVGPAKLGSFYWPRQGEFYLVFANYQNGFVQAIEEYRIVPLGLSSCAESISGKPLDEQIQTLLKIRLANIDQKTKELQEEKQRLELGVTK